MTTSKLKVALRMAAAAWAAGLTAPVVDSSDSTFAKLDARLMRAAIRYAAAARWLLDGNGYFLERKGCAGTTAPTPEEKDRARAEIDERMKEKK